jgi:hypothetical protein
MTRTIADQNILGAEAIKSIGRRGDERGMGVDAGRWGVLNQVGLEEDALAGDLRCEKPDSIPYNLRGALVGFAAENCDSRLGTPPIRDSAPGGLMHCESAGYCERSSAEE